MITEKLEITDFSLDSGSVFIVEYQWRTNDYNYVDVDCINLVGLFSYDPEDGEELSLDNLLKMQIKSINEELINKCCDDAQRILEESTSEIGYE